MPILELRKLRPREVVAMLCAVQPASARKEGRGLSLLDRDDQRSPGAGYSQKLKQQGPIHAQTTGKSLLRFLFDSPLSFLVSRFLGPQFGWGRVQVAAAQL